MTKKLIFIGVALVVLLVGLWLGSKWMQAPSEAPANTAAVDGELPYRAGPFRLDVDVAPEAPVVGTNTLTVRLQDAQGNPVRDAAIRAVAEMAAMGTMPSMRAPAEMHEASPGVYVGTFEPAMEGAWPLTLAITKGTGAATVSFDLATGRKGLALSSGGTRASGAAQGESTPAGTINVDAKRRQMIGLTTGIAEPRALTRTIRAVGRVAYDETQLADVSLKYEAWVGDVKADYVGKRVRKGEVLFTVYSPDLFAAQQEYLETSRRAGGGGDLFEAARQRLRFWDVSEDFIREITARGEPQKYVPIRAPRSGVIVEKNVVEGTAHPSGMRLMRIADLSRVWIEADVYEADLPLVEAGMPATVTLPYLPGTVLKGAVEYIYPYLQGKTRTARVRITFPNTGGVLKPDMYAEAKLIAPLGERLAVPEEAVLIAGEHRFVFEDLGGGRLAPRRVHTGYRADGFVEIRDGIEPGDRVVTSGNFLIASESRLKAGLDQW